MHSGFAVYIQLILFLAFLIPAICFFVTQYQTVQLIQPQFRRLHPGQVWFQLIPIFGLIWQFFVITRLSDSIRNQLAAPVEDLVFTEETSTDNRPTFMLGITYAILFCLATLPISILKAIIGAIAILCWVAYWIELNRYRKKIKSRLLVTGL
jgi:hypothetical protein